MGEQGPKPRSPLILCNLGILLGRSHPEGGKARQRHVLCRAQGPACLHSVTALWFLPLLHRPGFGVAPHIRSSSKFPDLQKELVKVAGILLKCEKPAFRRRELCASKEMLTSPSGPSVARVSIDVTPLEADLVVTSEFKVHKPFSRSIP